MNRHLVTLTSCPVLLLFSPLGLAQTNANQQQGLGSSLACGLSLTDATRATTDEETLVKAPKNQTSLPPAWSSTTFPNKTDYSLTAMFGSLTQWVEIDAEATGNDVIPRLDVNGIPQLTPRESWLAIVVSVDNNAQGLQGSLIERRRLAGVQPGADLFSYYYDTSVGIHSSLVGATMIEQTRQQMGFGPNEEVDAVDFGLGVISHAQQTPRALFFENDTQFYFSVTSTSAGDLNANASPSFAVTSTGADATADGGTVYKLTWDPTARRWGNYTMNQYDPRPEVYRSSDVLGLSGEEDIDALAVDPGHETIVFSTRGFARSSQLLVFDAQQGIVWDLRNEAGVKVTVRLGSNDDTDDVDGLCGWDPERHERATHFGIAADWFKWPGVPDPMGFSVTRAGVLGMNDDLIMQVTGWGTLPQSVGFTYFFVSLDYDPSLPWSSATWYQASQGMLRIPGNDVVEHSFPIPQFVGPVAVGAIFVDYSSGQLRGSLISQVR